MVTVLGDRPNGGAEANCVSERLGQALGHEPGAAFHHVLLGSTLDREERVDAAVGPDQEKQMEIGRVVEVTGEQAAHRHVEEVTVPPRSGSRSAPATRPPSARPTPARASPSTGRRGGPSWRSIEAGLGQSDRGHRHRADLGDQPSVAEHPTPVDEEVGAFHPGLVGGDAEVAGEPEHRIVLRGQPCAAAVHRRAVGEVLCPDPTTDPVAGLEDDDGLPPRRAGEWRWRARRSRRPRHRRRLRPFGHAACTVVRPTPGAPRLNSRVSAQFVSKRGDVGVNKPAAPSGTHPERA